MKKNIISIALIILVISLVISDKVAAQDAPPPSLPPIFEHEEELKIEEPKIEESTTTETIPIIDQFFSSTKILKSTDEEQEKPNIVELPTQSEELIKFDATENEASEKKVKKAPKKPAIPAFNYKTVSMPKSIYHRHNANDNRHLPLAYFKSDWPQLLGMAVRKNDLNQLRSLASNGANIRGDDENGVPLLIIAARYQRIEVARWLLMQGFNPNTTDDSGLTPLHYANFANNKQLISLLKLYKADELIADNAGNTPSDYASKTNK